MMHAEVTFKGRTYKQVRVTDASGLPQRKVLDLALSAAREDRSSIWGWTLTPVPDDPRIAIVVLHTD